MTLSSTLSNRTYIIMTATSSQTISAKRIDAHEALEPLVRSFEGLPNIPASLYLSMGADSLVIYIAPLGTVNLIRLTYLADALQQRNTSASALKSFLEASIATKVFFDARTPAKVLFDRCGIKLANPVRLT
jgi:hypothetical protein